MTIYRNVTFAAYAGSSNPVNWLLLHRHWSGVNGG